MVRQTTVVDDSNEEASSLVPERPQSAAEGPKLRSFVKQMRRDSYNAGAINKSNFITVTNAFGNLRVPLDETAGDGAVAETKSPKQKTQNTARFADAIQEENEDNQSSDGNESAHERKKSNLKAKLASSISGY
ncbi:hypothetical protein Ciccas_009481 [Cichlidogyrus casuarinus]|uniref:Uncharacterized protein n=1 Tax=Cichlidogyrus casuarinus TaxID=1844966 RepID=A0ABD2PXM3_9PLAT